MLILNFIRALLIFFGIGLYRISQMDFLSISEGISLFAIIFIGLMLREIIEDYVVRQFNPEDQVGRVFRG